MSNLFQRASDNIEEGKCPSKVLLLMPQQGTKFLDDEKNDPTPMGNAILRVIIQKRIIENMFAKVLAT